MTEDFQANKRGECSAMYLFVLHCTCFLLVVVYVNMFQFWAWLSRELGPGTLAKILPIIVTLAVLFFISFYFVQRVNRGYQIKFVFLALGVVGSFLALAIPDPNIPIKRIHVAEYIVLSFLVRYALSKRIKGVNLFAFTALVTALYGVHDEMLQGLHSLRYYGWRDIIVNCVAGLSGSLLGHGLVSFEGKNTGRSLMEAKPVSVGQTVLYILLLAAVIWQVIYLYFHLGQSISIYAGIPVFLTCTVIGIFCPGLVFNSRKHHGMQTFFWLALALCVYPALAGIGWKEFL